MANSIAALSFVLFSFTIISQITPTISHVAEYKVSPPTSPGSTATSASMAVISSICMKSCNPEYCTKVLKTAKSTTDVKELASYTLNLALTNAQKSYTLATSSAAAATDPILKERYTTCSGNYKDAIASIETAQKNLASGDFPGVNLMASSVFTTVGDCHDSFEQPPFDTSSLLKDGKSINDLCGIILVISNILPKPYSP